MGGRCDGKSFLMGRQLPPIAPPLLCKEWFFLNFCLCYFLLCCLCRYDHPLSIIVLCFARCPYSSLFRFAWLHFVERVLWNVFGLPALVFHFIVVVADIMLAHLSQNGCEYKSQQPILRHCGCCNPSPGMWAVRDSRSKMSKQSLVKKKKKNAECVNCTVTGVQSLTLLHAKSYLQRSQITTVVLLLPRLHGNNRWQTEECTKPPPKDHIKTIQA